MTLAYYNEYDDFAASWLVELIAEKVIAPGIVDRRDVRDVVPSDLKGFTQCHFFAGIGIWSLALREAGWSDDRPIWTASCPCQPFSAAGKGNGFDDERHLWPSMHWIIERFGNAFGKPDVIVGEQVASADGLAWLDLVSADMEGTGYAFGAIDTCAAGFSAPHIRQRLYWGAIADGVGLADTIGNGLQGCAETLLSGQRGGQKGNAPGCGGERLVDGLAYAEGIASGAGFRDIQPAKNGCAVTGDSRDLRRMADTTSGKSWDGELQSSGQHGQFPQNHRNIDDHRIPVQPVNYWANTEWLLCRDPDGPRFRPVEPGSFPLVDARSVRNRLDEVRGAGNAINIAQATNFIAAMMDVIGR